MRARRFLLVFFAGCVLLLLVWVVATRHDPNADRDLGRAIGEAEKRAVTQVVRTAKTAQVRAGDMLEGHNETSPFCSAVLAPVVGGGTLFFAVRRKRSR